MDLILADFHLSDHPLEEYRWNVFKWIYQLDSKYKFKTIYILGDLTEKKDHHPAKLVNRLTEAFEGLYNRFERVAVLRGNHDSIDPDWPFFHFLKAIGVEFYYQPTIVDKELFLPYSKDLKGDLISVVEGHMQISEKVNRIFMHQTVRGAVASNGSALDGVSDSLFNRFPGLIFSGDVHMPQEVGDIHYVGSPYPVYFGDRFFGGGILLDRDKWERVENRQTIRRNSFELDYTQEEVPEFEVHPGDQFKIRMLVNRGDSGEFDKWKKNLREFITEQKGMLVSIEIKFKEEKRRLISRARKLKSIEPEDVLHRYCQAEGLDDYYFQKGKELL